MRYPLAYAFGAISVVAVVVWGFLIGGVGMFALPVIGLVYMPFADRRRRLSLWPSEAALARMSSRTERRYARMLVVAAAAQVGLLGWALWAVSVTPLVWWELLGFALSVGLVSGFVGIATAHELLHRGAPAAFPMMALLGYSHYCIEHIGGHHVNVATREDAATARRGESFYTFLPRTIAAGLRSACRIERKRLARLGIGAFSLSNRLLVWHGATLALGAAIGLLLGPTSLILFVIQAAVAVSILAAIDYLEHYGLARERLPDGRYERIGPAHAWNSNHLVTNLSSFNLGRHTAHHIRASTPYHRLRAEAEAPQLPHGYFTTMLIALVPPLWFRVMDRELDAWRAARAG